MAGKTMRRIILLAILFIVIAGAACAALYVAGSGTAFEGARTAVLNAALDGSGLKAKAESELRERAGAMAEQYGVPQSLLDSGIDALDIPSWEVTDTPPSESVADTLDFDVSDTSVHVTTYDDPSVITLKSEGKIDTFGQSISFKIPESAQGFAELLPYVELAQDLGNLAG